MNEITSVNGAFIDIKAGIDQYAKGSNMGAPYSQNGDGALTVSDSITGSNRNTATVTGWPWSGQSGPFQAGQFQPTVTIPLWGGVFPLVSPIPTLEKVPEKSPMRVERDPQSPVRKIMLEE